MKPVLRNNRQGISTAFVGMGIHSYCHLLVILPLLVCVSSIGDECPPWFILDKSNDSHFPQCVCSVALDSFIICSQREHTSYIKVGHCAFQDETTNDTVVTGCFYTFPPHLVHNGLIRLPPNVTDLNTFICEQLTRELGSPLCGRCTNGTGPSIYSLGSQCASCSRLNILYYLLLQYAPITIIFLAIILSQISLVSPPMAHYVLYCNIMQMLIKIIVGSSALYASTNTHVMIIIRLLLALNSLWTLDPLYLLSPPLCISQDFHEIYIPFLDTLAALYPFTLLLLTYILIKLYTRDCKIVVVVWKVIHRRCGCLLGPWNSDKSLIQAFATLFFLSFMKFIGIVNNAFMLSLVLNMKGQVVAKVPFIDPTVTLLSYTHLSLVILSVLILVFFLLPPVLLLLLFPTTCITKLSMYLKPRWVLTLKIFADTLYGGYKDGTNGTKDFRQTAGIIFLFWIVQPTANVIFALLITNNISFPWSITFPLLALITSIACAVFQPYKHRAANISGTILSIIFIITGGLYFIVDAYTYSSGMALLGITAATYPHCVFYGYGIYRLGKWLKHCTTTTHGDEGVLRRLL